MMASHSRKNARGWGRTANRFEFISSQSRSPSPSSASPSEKETKREPIDNASAIRELDPSSRVTRRANDAAIFVANLPHQLPDPELEALLFSHFDAVAKVRKVKVLHDPKVIAPYAFVHFEDTRQSEIAIAQRNNTQLGDRTIRCEPAKAYRTLLLSFSQSGIEGSNRLEWVRLRRDRGSRFVHVTFNEEAKSPLAFKSDANSRSFQRYADPNRDILCGEGRLIRIDPSNISKSTNELMSAFGPLESVICQKDDPSQQETDLGTPQKGKSGRQKVKPLQEDRNSSAFQITWKVKYELRSDAISAFNTLRHCPNLQVSWEHLAFKHHSSTSVAGSLVENKDSVNRLALELQNSFRFKKYEPERDQEIHTASFNVVRESKPPGNQIGPEASNTPAGDKEGRREDLDFPPLKPTAKNVSIGLGHKAPQISKEDLVSALQYGSTLPEHKSIPQVTHPRPHSRNSFHTVSSPADQINNMHIVASPSTPTAPLSVKLPLVEVQSMPAVDVEEVKHDAGDREYSGDVTPKLASASSSPDSSTLETPKKYYQVELPPTFGDEGKPKFISIEVSTPTPPSKTAALSSVLPKEVDQTLLSVPVFTFTVGDERDYDVIDSLEERAGPTPTGSHGDRGEGLTDQPTVPKENSHSRSLSDTEGLDSTGGTNTDSFTEPSKHLEVSHCRNSGTRTDIIAEDLQSIQSSQSKYSADEVAVGIGSDAPSALEHVSSFSDSSQLEESIRDERSVCGVENTGLRPLPYHVTPEASPQIVRVPESSIVPSVLPLPPQGFVSTDNGLVPIYSSEDFARHMNSFHSPVSSSTSSSSSPGRSPVVAHPMGPSPWIATHPPLGWMSHGGFYPATLPFMLPPHPHPMMGVPTSYLPLQAHFAEPQYIPHSGYPTNSHPTAPVPVRHETSPYEINDSRAAVHSPFYPGPDTSETSRSHFTSPPYHHSHHPSSMNWAEPASRNSTPFSSAPHGFPVLPSFQTGHSTHSDSVLQHRSQYYAHHHHNPYSQPYHPQA
ncbi:hypothetical protein FRC02_007011 [Tulasnella sp. 418]|nr:hypothetical protein FRC02_007011 [Tulasnella sp. 418]